MLNFIAFISVLSFSAVILANESIACKKIEKIQLQMDVIASNIANVETTRTPEGGPYLRKELICQKKGCSVRTSGTIKFNYMPEHPDADESGYVKYPDIDLSTEIAAMNQAKWQYEIFAKNCND